MDARQSILSDEPATEDRLGRLTYAEALADLSESCNTPLVVGLYGGWGVGKTTLMNLVQSQLKPSVRTVRFDAWQHQGDEDPALSLMHTIVDELALGRRGKKILAAIALALGAALLKGANLNVRNLSALADQYERERFMVRDARVRMRERFGQLLRLATVNGRKRLVVLIDDLDRCTPEVAVSLLESLKLYLNFPDCVYFLAVDRNILEESIRRHHEVEIDHTSYLDKIVQLPFTIPPIAPEAMGGFVAPLLPEPLTPCRELLVAGLGDNPRAVKRFINTLFLNDRLARAARIPGYDVRVLALLLLIHRHSPALFSAVRQDAGALLRLVKDEDPVLRESFLEEDHQLLSVVEAVRAGAFIHDMAPITECIYLTQPASAGPSNLAGSGAVTGKVEWFGERKGYGLITPDDGTEQVFLHYSDIQGEGYKTAKPGDVVRYVPVWTSAGWRAQNVTVLVPVERQQDS